VGQYSLTGRGPAVQRTFWETYTPRNIVNEIKFRLSSLARFRSKSSDQSEIEIAYDRSHAENVGQFYDTYHDQFMKVYGDVIQAFRTKDITDLLNHQIKAIGFQHGQRVLDAGCGTAAPAIYFARRTDIIIDAITISKVQSDVANQKIDEAGLRDRVRIRHGDYHELKEYFDAGVYDIVYFLESFGHSTAKRRLIKASWDMLKPGGTLYVKDLFTRIPLRREHEEKIRHEIRKINQAYRYEVADLNAVLDDLRAHGFLLTSLKAVELDLDQFEDLAISNEFQELTGLALIQDWNEYVFPVDFFEIKCMKPEFSLSERLDRHFLQNRYHAHHESKAKAFSPTHFSVCC
jgi:cyclopropane fatty-acyl-phospholipid synthase-like methyltransferase